MSQHPINQQRRAFLGTSAVVLSSAVMAGRVTATSVAGSSQSDNVRMPAVIGYPNEKGVTIERVTYPARNLGTRIVANLFRPAGFSTERRYAAVVVTHPFGGVK